MDDEEALRRLLTHALRQSGFAVESAACGRRALEVARRLGGALAASLGDKAMPGPDGLDTIAAVRGLAPAARCFLMTGGHYEYTAAELEAAGVICLIRKPFSVGEVADALRCLVPPDWPARRLIDHRLFAPASATRNASAQHAGC